MSHGLSLRLWKQGGAQILRMKLRRLRASLGGALRRGLKRRVPPGLKPVGILRCDAALKRRSSTVHFHFCSFTFLFHYALPL